MGYAKSQNHRTAVREQALGKSAGKGFDDLFGSESGAEEGGVDWANVDSDLICNCIRYAAHLGYLISFGSGRANRWYSLTLFNDGEKKTVTADNAKRMNVLLEQLERGLRARMGLDDPSKS